MPGRDGEYAVGRQCKGAVLGGRLVHGCPPRRLDIGFRERRRRARHGQDQAWSKTGKPEKLLRHVPGVAVDDEQAADTVAIGFFS